jgi:hypothetical protein
LIFKHFVWGAPISISFAFIITFLNEIKEPEKRPKNQDKTNFYEFERIRTIFIKKVLGFIKLALGEQFQPNYF